MVYLIWPLFFLIYFVTCASLPPSDEYPERMNVIISGPVLLWIFQSYPVLMIPVHDNSILGAPSHDSLTSVIHYVSEAFHNF